MKKRISGNLRYLDQSYEYQQSRSLQLLINSVKNGKKQERDEPEMNCQPRSVDSTNNIHDRDRAVKKLGTGIAAGQAGQEQDMGVLWEMLWGNAPYGNVQRAGACCRVEPLSPSTRCVCCTSCSPAFFHLGGFYLNQDLAFGRAHRSRDGCARTKTARNIQAGFNRGLKAVKNLQSPALWRYLRHYGYRDLLLILPTVQNFTGTPRRYR